MTKLNEYFDNELSAQEQLEVQMWLAEHGGQPGFRRHSWPSFSTACTVDDDAAARAAFGRVAHRLGIAGGAAVRTLAPCTYRRLEPANRRYTRRSAPVRRLAALTPTASRRRNGSNSRFRTAKWPPLTLPDGTQLHLNSGSRITYPSAFTGKKERRGFFVEGEDIR